jgi:UDP-N-acetylmuramoyl-L-alanyl-D-glutamate--2,6-diaminopimelate ligase
VSAITVLAELEQLRVKATGLAVDSRRVAPGDVFVAMPGHHVDGRTYAVDAVRRGAAAVLYEAGEPPMLDVPAIPVTGLAVLAGEIAHLVYERPSERLWMAGVTGTNGKTSVSQWIAQAMCLLDRKCGVIGTLGGGFPGQLIESVNTTPDAVSVHRALAGFADEGAVACAMEVSSIGIEEGRVNGVHFDVASFTNLTRDHLEYHGSMEVYGAAKEKLFGWPGLGTAVINLDDPFGAQLAARLAGRVPTIGYTLENREGGDRVLAARDIVMSGATLSFTVDGVRFEAPVVGRFNISNLLGVIGALLAGDETLADIAAVLHRIEPPPGRMQAVGGHGRPLVVVDYAHTPDALEKALGTLRDTAAARCGKLVCIFGCGGDRDPGKRPLMGAMAERLADRVLVTSDNPRSEDPLAIIEAIASGMKHRPAIEPDREAAIRCALAEAAADDVVLLAGKGHEPYQEIAGVRRPFSDLALAREALESWT